VGLGFQLAKSLQENAQNYALTSSFGLGQGYLQQSRAFPGNFKSLIHNASQFLKHK
jgi:hypothetical protein